MHTTSSRFLRLRFRLDCRCWLHFFVCLASFPGMSVATSIVDAQEAKQSREPATQLRLPRQEAQTGAALDGIVRSSSATQPQLPVAGASLQLRNLASNVTTDAVADGEGVFRVFPLMPGESSLRIQAEGFATFSLEKFTLHANEVLTLEISLLAQPSAEARSRVPRLPELGRPLPAEVAAPPGSYREFRHRLDSDPNYVLNPAPESLPPPADVFATVPDRWALQQPEYKRYSSNGEYIYTRSRWFDPFNRNRFKGDEPIWPAETIAVERIEPTRARFDRRIPVLHGRRKWNYRGLLR